MLTVNRDETEDLGGSPLWTCSVIDPMGVPINDTLRRGPWVMEHEARHQCELLVREHALRSRFRIPISGRPIWESH